MAEPDYPAVILGGLAALYEITGDHAYLDRGESVAAATLSTPASARVPGILVDPCEMTAAVGQR
jgi:uncharacterized protein YyaL (SSP411 family)